MIPKGSLLLRCCGPSTGRDTYRTPFQLNYCECFNAICSLFKHVSPYLLRRCHVLLCLNFPCLATITGGYAFAFAGQVAAADGIRSGMDNSASLGSSCSPATEEWNRTRVNKCFHAHLVPPDQNPTVNLGKFSSKPEPSLPFVDGYYCTLGDGLQYLLVGDRFGHFRRPIAFGRSRLAQVDASMQLSML